MAVLVDSSTPVRASQSDVSGGLEATTASFTAPANALLVACINHDSNGTQSGFSYTVSDTGGLTWTQRVIRDTTESPTEAMSAIYTARTTSSASRTVSFGSTWSGGSALYRSIKVYVLTGVDVDGTPVDTTGANNEGGTVTNDFNTTSITAGANGLLICCDTDWTAAGDETSSDLTVEGTTFTGFITVFSGYKTVSSGASVSGNINAGGTADAHHKWCQIVVREAAAAGSPQYYYQQQAITAAL